MARDPNVQDDSDPRSGSSLVPMLVLGLASTLIGLLIVAAFV